MKVLAHLILVFSVYVVGSIWANDYKKLTYEKLFWAITMMFIGGWLNPKMFIDVMIMFSLYILIANNFNIFVSKLMVSLFYGMLLHYAYKSFRTTSSASIKVLFVVLFMFLLHISVFPENWKRCAGTYNRLCYVKD